MIPCDEIIDVMDIASTTIINSIAANATSGVSTNYQKLSWIKAFLIVIIELFIIIFICHYYTNISKEKHP